MSATAATAHRLPTDEERAKQLRELAEQVIEDAELHDELLAAAAPLISPYLPADLHREAFDDFCDQVDRQQDLNDGLLHWREIEPRLSGLDPDTAAAEIQQQMVSDALDRLLYGDR